MPFSIQPYSLLIAAGALALVLGVVLLRGKPTARDYLAFGGIMLALIVAWFAIRPTQTPLMGAAADVQARIGHGQPVLLEFQSPY
jgi:drug/metabolite transporter superfamily protein YnfA